MASHNRLRGACSCGRNQYRIEIPNDAIEDAQVYFDSSRDSRRFHGTPLTAWLRVPLDWYQSYTRSFFPDETHASIRRTFTPHDEPASQRIFCGFCGTPLTLWTEEPAEEGDFMSVAIGSLFGEDQHVLEDLDLLPEDLEEEAGSAAAGSPSALAPPSQATSSSSAVVPSFGPPPGLTRSYRHGTLGGIPWFEEMVEGSRLGRHMRQQRGMGVSGDQSTSFEWEISEWHDDGTGALVQEDSNGHATGKRKRGRRSDAKGGSSQKRAES
ncbi:hypothetical protein N7474_004799 [Penicillium riverlandense]|uniref:uncharacterized protein n=1 Tax=Penicillium riverlandense TaxID=1903569 RepID=UPI0025478A3E|nr:uncharacterized protein N7474_004799 [Penicillium riverlandense]KAJ5819208.1 hypothetical protein N7474_004799 [Penicillium riverlandense]